jgi:lipopolysaccharide export system protein LptA
MTWLAALLLLALPASAAEPVHEGRPVVGGVVRSKEWVIRRAPHREEEFVGEVNYHKGPSLLTSDWALFKHEPQLWDARGHVRLQHTLKSGDRIEVSGETARYDQKTALGRMLPSQDALVSYSRTPLEGAPDQGTARRLEWEGQERVHLLGQAHVWGPRLEVWGDRADYDAADGKLTVIGGRPVVHVLQGDWTGAVQGDTVTALQKPDRMLADGNTKGWIRFKDKPGQKKK